MSKTNQKLKKDEHYKLQLSKYKRGFMPRKLKKQIAKEEFSGRFSEQMMDVILSKGKKKYSKKLPSTDLAKALQLRNLSSKAYNFVRSILPFPHLDTLRKKFSFLRIMHGSIIHPIMMFLEHLVAKYEPDSLDLLGVLGFDEINLSNRAEIDPRFGNIIGEPQTFKIIRL